LELNLPWAPARSIGMAMTNLAPVCGNDGDEVKHETPANDVASMSALGGKQTSASWREARYGCYGEE